MPLRAKETFFVGNTKVTRGQLVNDRDPIAKGRGALFEDPSTVEVPVIEQATRAPGERRRISLPRRESKPAGGLTTKDLPKKAQPEEEAEAE